MAELSLQERLQPSLLDRLSDHDPDKNEESRDARVLSVRDLRGCVLRDLSWLLNTVHLQCVEDLDDAPQVVDSVLNYGVPELSGLTSSGVSLNRLENRLRQAIADFEPRILRNSLKVNMTLNIEEMGQNAMTLEIEGDLWAQPLPLRLYLKTEIDLDLGHVKVMEAR